MHSDRASVNVASAAALRLVVVEARCLNRRLLVDWLQKAWPAAEIDAVADPTALDEDLLPVDLALFGLGAAAPSAPAVAAAILHLSKRIGSAPLVVLGEREELAVVTAALQIGASGYVPTSFDPSTAVRAFEFVLAGGTFVPARSLVEAGRSARSSAPPRRADAGELPSLTPRERDVAAAVCAGKPNKIIAHELQISEATVKVFVRLILRKVGATNRTEAASAIHRYFGELDEWPGTLSARRMAAAGSGLQGSGRSKRTGMATRTA